MNKTIIVTRFTVIKEKLLQSAATCCNLLQILRIYFDVTPKYNIIQRENVCNDMQMSREASQGLNHSTHAGSVRTRVYFRPIIILTSY